MKWPDSTVMRQQRVVSFSMAGLVVGGSVFVHGWTTAALKPTIVTFAIVWCVIDAVFWFATMLRRVRPKRGDST